MRIQKIKLEELQAFIKSKLYSNLPVVPITPLRVDSYLSNPNSLEKDTVLYMGFIEDELIAFRTVWAEIIHSGSTPSRFGWCSGNWVHPHHRRRGHSERLLEEIYGDWKGKLMFTNYAPSSEQLYIKTGWFKPIHQYDGIRAYLFPSLLELKGRPGKKSIKNSLFRLADNLIRVTASVRCKFYREKVTEGIVFEETEQPDKSCLDLLDEQASKHVFHRDSKTLKWIFDYPWISNTDNSFQTKYPFSSYSKDFHYRTVKISIKEKLAGFFIYSVNNGHFKLLTTLTTKPIEKHISQYVRSLSAGSHLKTVTIYNSRIAEDFFDKRFPFLRVRHYGQKIYSTFETGASNQKLFQDADGDSFFT